MSKLRQVLSLFENSGGPLSLPAAAHSLDVTPEMLEGLILHWVRKGKIRESGSLTNCGTCGQGQGCPFIVQMPRCYELVAEEDERPLELEGINCEHFSR